MPRQLFTIGYEGVDVDSFIEALQKHSIECLLDVRELPLSRKKGFSKNVLAGRLKEWGISYVHFKELGSPSDLRNNLKKTKNYTLFFEEMSQHIDKNIDAIRQAHDFVRHKTCCLMCFEKSHEKCHRSLVADKIKKYYGNGLKVSNILTWV